MLIFNIVILYIILQMVYNITKQNVKYNSLGCGNFGWSGDDPSKFNRDKFITLGVLNEERGTDSCGLFVDGKLYRGDDIGQNNEAKFRNMVRKNKFPSPSKIPVIIGHTRNSSRFGVKSIENTHPFMFRKEDGNYFVGSHNGTLQNHNFLAEKYNIDKKDSTGRIKVDSEILLEILSNQNENNNNIRVLQEYEGAAALVMFNSKFPDEVWFWKGYSKKSTHMQPALERPLNVWYDQPGSVYWSSDVRDLETIAGVKHTDENSKIYSIPNNTLCSMKNGKIEKKVEVNRESNRKFTTTYEYERYLKEKDSKKSKGSNHNASNHIVNYRQNRSINNDKDNKDDNATVSLQKLQSKSIFYEKVITTDEKMSPDAIIYEKLRYMKDGKFAKNGVYIYTKQRGLYFLSDSVKKAKEKLNNLTISDLTKTSTNTKMYGNKSDLTLYYIINGIMLKDELDYAVAMDKGPNNLSLSDYSYMSKYPVCHYYTIDDLEENKLDILKTNNEMFVNKIISNGAVCYYNCFNPIASNYTYLVKRGSISNKTIKLTLNKLPHGNVMLDEDDFGKDNNFVENLNKSIKEIQNKEEREFTDESVDFNDEELYNKYYDFEQSMRDAFEIGKSIIIDHPDQYDHSLNLMNWIDEAEKNFEPISVYIKNSILEESNEDETEDEDEYDYDEDYINENIGELYHQFGPKR